MPTVFVPEEELAAMRREVMTKYGKLYGSLREEVKKAIARRVEELRAENAKEGRTPKGDVVDLETMSPSDLKRLVAQGEALLKKRGKK